MSDLLTLRIPRFLYPIYDEILGYDSRSVSDVVFDSMKWGIHLTSLVCIVIVSI